LYLNTAFLRKIYDSVLPKSRPLDSSPTLLIIEDSPTDYLLLRKQLEPLADKAGIQLLHAASLAEAVRQLDLADAIILDMLLPDANDPRTNRLFAELAQLPVILHTGSHDEIGDKLAQRIGAEIVRKDQPPEVLEAAVKRMIEGMKDERV
jgi:CheY-like chemotaxis protein